MRHAIAVAIAIACSTAHADTPPDSPEPTPPADSVDDHLTRARDFHEHGDFAHARDELLLAYQLAPQRPELLFALGQMEFNLHHYKAAIDYYERFNATGPDPDQAALAQQGIGAARIELARPPPVPQPKPSRPHPRWDLVDTGLVVIGGIGVTAGVGLLVDVNQLANDRSGTLDAYDHRIDQAHTRRLAAEGCFAAGGVAIGIALLHWRIHLVDTVIEVHPNPGGAGVTLSRPL